VNFITLIAPMSATSSGWPRWRMSDIFCAGKGASIKRSFRDILDG